MARWIWSKSEEELALEAQEAARLSAIERRKENAAQAQLWINQIVASGITLVILGRILKTKAQTLANFASGKSKQIPDKLFLLLSDYYDSWRIERIEPVAKTQDRAAVSETLLQLPEDTPTLDKALIDREIARIEHRVSVLKQLLELGKQL
jgi:hypothetical protein